MMCWAYLIARALRRHLARRAHHHSVQRIRQLLDQRLEIDSELLQALRAERAAEQRMKQISGVA